MARVKRGVTAHKRHKRLLNDAEGRKGTKSRLIKPAREALLHALAYATRDRKQRKRQMRELWIIRINAAARQNGLTYGAVHQRPQEGGRRDRPQDPGRPRHPRRGDVWPHRRARQGRLTPGPRAEPGPARSPRRRRRSRVRDSRARLARTKDDRGPRRPDPRPRGAARRGARVDRGRAPTSPTLDALELDVLGKKGRLTGGPARHRRAAGRGPAAGRRHRQRGPRARSRPPSPSAARRCAARRSTARLARRGRRRHDARPPDPARHPPPEHRDDARDRRDLRPVRVRGLRGPRDRGRPDQLPDAQHPARPSRARPVGHAVRRRRGPPAADPHVARPDPGDARDERRRSGRCCPAAASATRRSTRATPRSSSRSRA